MHAKIIGGLMMALVCTLSLPFAQAVSAQLAPTVSAQGAPGDHIYVTVKGAKQGLFKGEIAQPRKGLENKFRGLKFRYEIIRTQDPATGLPGRSHHKPVTITKEWGAASPQLYVALMNNEPLPEVVIDFVGASTVGVAAGTEVLSHQIKLTNALVVDISDSTEPTAGGGVLHLDDVTFVYQKIELVDVRGNTMAMDNWTQ